MSSELNQDYVINGRDLQTWIRKRMVGTEGTEAFHILQAIGRPHEHLPGTLVTADELERELTDRFMVDGYTPGSGSFRATADLHRPDTVARNILSNIRGRHGAEAAAVGALDDEPVSDDPEISALAQVADTLQALTPPQRCRVIRYLADRFDVDICT